MGAMVGKVRIRHLPLAVGLAILFTLGFSVPGAVAQQGSDAPESGVERLPRSPGGTPVVDRPLGDQPTPEQIEEWRNRTADQMRREEDERQRQLDEVLDRYRRQTQNEDYLREAWDNANTGQSFDDWLNQRLEEHEDEAGWRDDFEDSAWDDPTPDEIREDAISGLAADMREEQAMREEYGNSNTDLSYEDWLDQRSDNGFHDDFENWGDEDWDDASAGEEESEGQQSDADTDEAAEEFNPFEAHLNEIREALLLVDDIPEDDVGVPGEGPGTGVPPNLPPGAIPATDLEAAKRAICASQPSAAARQWCFDAMGRP